MYSNYGNSYGGNYAATTGYTPSTTGYTPSTTGYAQPALAQPAHSQPSSVFSAAQAWNANHGPLTGSSGYGVSRYGPPTNSGGSGNYNPLYNSVAAVSSTRSAGWEAAPSSPQDNIAALRARAQSAFDPSSRFDFAGANSADRVRMANMQEELRDKDAEIGRLRAELDMISRERGSSEQFRARCAELEAENVRLREEANRARDLAHRQEQTLAAFENRARALEAEVDTLRRGGQGAPPPPPGIGFEGPPPGVGGVPFGVQQRAIPPPPADFYTSPRGAAYDEGTMQTFFPPPQSPPPQQPQQRGADYPHGGIAQEEPNMFEKLLSVFDKNGDDEKKHKRRHSVGAIPAPQRTAPVGYGGGAGAGGYGAETFFAESRSQDQAYAGDYGNGNTEAFLSRQNSSRRGGGGAAVSIAPGTTINRDPRTGMLLPKPLADYQFGRQPTGPMY